MDELKEYHEHDVHLLHELYERFNVTRIILLEVLTLQGIKFYEIHDSISCVNPDDGETLMSHIQQLYAIGEARATEG